MKKTILFSLVLVATLLSPSVVKGAAITCTEQTSGGSAIVYHVCNTISGMEKPGNCDLQGATQMKCTGEPNGYTCSGSGTSHSCDVTPAVCAAASGGYDCGLPISGKLPSGCTSSGGGIHCSATPAGYTVQDSGASPTSVVPTSQQVATTPIRTAGGNINYTPLEPLPGFPATGNVDFPTFLSALFKILFSLGALLAVGRMVLGGIMYMTSEVTETKSDARRWMTGSLYGLLLLAGSALILYTINPALLNLSFSITKNGQNTTTLPFVNRESTAPATQAQIDQCSKEGGSIHPFPDGTWACK